MVSEQLLTVSAEQVTGPVVVLTAAGEIDHDSQSVLNEAAADALESGGHRLIIDLAAVPFCDSGGLSLFVRLHRQAAERGGSLWLANAQDSVRTVLKITNLDRMLAIHSTTAQAIQAALAAG